MRAVGEEDFSRDLRGVVTQSRRASVTVVTDERRSRAQIRHDITRRMAVFPAILRAIGPPPPRPAASRAAPRCRGRSCVTARPVACCGADDRQALEQSCRYIARPAPANERVRTNAAGQVVLKLNTPWRDGITHLVMSTSPWLTSACCRFARSADPLESMAVRALADAANVSRGVMSGRPHSTSAWVIQLSTVRPAQGSELVEGLGSKGPSRHTTTVSRRHHATPAQSTLPTHALTRTKATPYQRPGVNGA